MMGGEEVDDDASSAAEISRRLSEAQLSKLPQAFFELYVPIFFSTFNVASPVFTNTFVLGPSDMVPPLRRLSSSTCTPRDILYP